MCVSQVIPSSKMPCSQPPPGEGAYPPGEGVCPPRTGACPREQLSNKMARMFVMQRKVKEVSSKESLSSSLVCFPHHVLTSSSSPSPLETSPPPAPLPSPLPRVLSPCPSSPRVLSLCPSSPRVLSPCPSSPRVLSPCPSSPRVLSPCPSSPRVLSPCPSSPRVLSPCPSSPRVLSPCPSSPRVLSPCPSSSSHYISTPLSYYVQLKDDVGKLLAGQYPGGVVTTPLASFNSPQFTKVKQVFL